MAAVLAACSSGDDGSTTSASTGTGTGVTVDGTAPTAPSTAEPGAAGFQRVTPGGDCRCADGSDYHLYEREADPTKVVLFLQGGGACFSAETCSESAGATSKLRVEPGDDPSDDAGIFDFSDPRNPLAEYSFVYAPYCTGDVYLGNKTNEYSASVTVHHKGFVNASAALDHVVSTFPDVEELVVAGESAGSIASPLFAGLASDRLPDAQITVLADGSGAYSDVPAVNAGIGALWGTEKSVPDWPETEDVVPEDWSIPGLFTYAGTHAPDIVFARHDYAYDRAQRAFADATGVAGPDLLQAIHRNEQQIERSGVELASYIAPGDAHTTLSQPSFYTEEVGGVQLVDWVTDLVNGEPVDDVQCETCRPPAPPPPPTTG